MSVKEGSRYSLTRFVQALFQSCDGASLAFFRIGFGAIMLWEVYVYGTYDRIFWEFIQPIFHFGYYGFEWVKPWPGIGMYIHFAILGIAAFCIMIGCFYRLATIVHFFAFTYIFLLDQALYLNHFYLVCLVSFLMIFIPANRMFSVDSWRKPETYSPWVPLWALWIMRIQIAIPYFYGGIAKLNYDWLNAEPISSWLARRSFYPVIGDLFSNEWMGYFFAYGGLFYDLLVVPLLIWRKTRAFAFACTLFFHLTNAYIFDIGIFPWFMIIGTTLFFEPDWPRGHFGFNSPSEKPLQSFKLGWRRWLGASLMGVYLLIQFLMPLRHFFYPGIVHWNEEGHRFAWHMKLRDKKGYGDFYVYVPSQNKRYVVMTEQWLTPLQVRKMLTRPDMLLQFAHYIADIYREQMGEDVKVYAKVFVSLNGRVHQQFIDPDVDLAAQERTLKHVDWVLPLKNYKQTLHVK